LSHHGWKRNTCCLAGFVIEEHIVRAVGIERRIEVYQVNGGVGDGLAQDGEVISVEEGVHECGFFDPNVWYTIASNSSGVRGHSMRSINCCVVRRRLLRILFKKPVDIEPEPP